MLERVLVLAPWGRDAQVICQVLVEQGLKAEVCPSLPALAERLQEGAGMAFITEETLVPPDTDVLTRWLEQQPAWSDFPLVVLATRRSGARSAEALHTLERLGNVVLLERPLHAETLLSAAKSALRGRRRQYQTARHLEEQIQARSETSRLFDAERVAREETMQATEKLAFALDAAGLGTFHIPLPLDTVILNDTGLAQLWLPPGTKPELAFETFCAMVHEDDRERVRRDIERTVAHRQPYDTEFRAVSPDGQCRWLRAKGMAYTGPRDTVPTRLDGITIDISSQKALEQQREGLLAAERGARMAAEHASRMKDEFLATLSHELRTPLAAIIGWTHVLRRATGSGNETARAVDTIERNARVQAKLIDDLLDMSRIISGHARLDLEALDVQTVVDNVLSSLEPTAQAKRLRFLSRNHGGRALVCADPSRLQQIVWNLLSNAIKFTPAQGEVQVAVDTRDAWVELTVQDSGQGIPAGFLPFVFDRFRQNDASTTRSHGGLGLGLAIVKHLVELHGGSVSAHSEGEGRGARFSIRLPLMATPPQAAPAGRQSARQASSRCRSGPEQASLAGARILVVDDEPDLRQLLQRVFEDRGAIVYAVGSATEALDCIEARHPHLLISDIGMPDLDGYTLMREVRQLEKIHGGHLPAIALTAFAGPDDRVRALQAGYSHHIAKPVDPEELVHLVEAELQERLAEEA